MKTGGDGRRRNRASERRRGTRLHRSSRHAGAGTIDRMSAATRWPPEKRLGHRRRVRRVRQSDSLQAALATELGQLESELSEIGMLVGQAHEETKRHESRRVKGDERVTCARGRSASDADELREARTPAAGADPPPDAVRGTGRSARGQAADAHALPGLAGSHHRRRWASLSPPSGRPARVATAQVAGRCRCAAPSAPECVRAANSTAVLRAQEDLRREIARQMHDGPAQSLANIALQSEIVERLVSARRSATPGGAEPLRGMVQSDADRHQGLHLRRAADGPRRPRAGADAASTRRATAAIAAASRSISIPRAPTGAWADQESGLFRIVDDVIAAYLAVRPARVSVRLDWTVAELTATVRDHWPTNTSIDPGDAGPPDLPPALRPMIDEVNTAERRATADAQSLLAPSAEGARRPGRSVAHRAHRPRRRHDGRGRRAPRRRSRTRRPRRRSRPSAGRQRNPSRGLLPYGSYRQDHRPIPAAIPAYGGHVPLGLTHLVPEAISMRQILSWGTVTSAARDSRSTP